MGANGASIEELSIDIVSSIADADKSLDRLAESLGRMSNALGSFSTSKFADIATGIGNLATSMQQMSTVKTTEFTRVSKGLTSLASVNVSNVGNTAQALNSMASSVSALNGLATAIQPINDFAAAIRTFGNVNVGRAITNMPQLGNAVTQLISHIGNTASLSQASTDLLKIAQSITRFGSQGASTAITNMPLLANAIRNFMTTMSTLPSVNGNVLKMIQSVAQLSTQGSKFNSMASTMEKRVRNLNTGFKAATISSSNLLSKFKSLASGIGNAAQKMYSLYLRAKMTAEIIEKALSPAMDYMETYNYFNVTMGKIADDYASGWEDAGYESAEAYGNSFKERINELTAKMTGFQVNKDGTLELGKSAQNLGLNVEKIMDYEAGIAAVTNSVGLMGDISVNASKALTMLAGDISSLRNVDLEVAMKNLQSGLIGQSRALYKYGIDITNATLQTYAYANGIDKAVSQMTQAEKMQLRLIAILDQSRVAWGDLANTLNSPANQLRILKQQFSNLAMTIGNLFLPVIQKILPYITAMVMALQQLFVWLGNILGVNLGKMISDSGTGFSSGVDDLADSAEDASDALDDATNSAKKLKTATLGIDELNVISDNSNGGADKNGAGGGVDLSGAIADALADYESVWDKAMEGLLNKAQEICDKIVAFFKRIWEATELVREALKKLWDEGFAKLLNFTWGTLRDFYYDFLVPLGEWTLGENGLPRFLNITNDLLNSINWEKLRTSLDNFYKILSKIAICTFDSLLDFYEYFLKPVAVWVGNKVLTTLLDTLTGFLKKINWDTLNGALENFYKCLSNFVVGIGQGLLDVFSFLADIALDIIASAINLVAGALEFLFGVLSMIPVSVLEAIGGAIGGILAAFLAYEAVTILIPAIAAGFTAFFSSLIAGIAHFAKFLELTIAFNPALAILAGVAAALGILTVAIVENKQAVEEAALGSMFDALETNGVTSIEAVGKVFTDTTNDILTNVDKTKEKIDSITETKESIDDTVENIDQIKAAIENGAYTVDEKVPEMIEDFQKLLDESRTIFEEEYDVLVSNIVGAWADILTAQGKSVPEYVSGLLEMTNQGKTAYTEIESSLNSLIEQYNNGDISAEEFTAKSSTLFEQLKAFNADGSIDSTTSAIQNLGGALDLSQYITDGSFDTSKFQTYMDTILQTATDGKENLSTLGEENAQTIADYKAQLEALGVDMSGFDWDALYGASEEQVTTGKANIDAAYTDYANQVQYNLMEQLPGVVEQATADYENLGWWQKLFTTKEEYVQQAITDWQDNILTPVTDSLQSGFETLGIDGETWAGEAATKMMDSLFVTTTEYFPDHTEHTTTLKDNWKTVLEDALDGAAEAVDAESYGKDTVTGYNDGITNNADTTKTAIDAWMDSIGTSIHDSSMNFGSPSQTAWDFGADTILGYNNGITENAESTTEAITMWMDLIVEQFALLGEQMPLSLNEGWLVNEAVLTDTISLFSENTLLIFTNLDLSLTTEMTNIATMFSTKWQAISTDTINKLTIMNTNISTQLATMRTNMNTDMILAANNWTTRWNTILETVKSACRAVMDAVAEMSEYVSEQCASMIEAIESVGNAAKSISGGGSISINVPHFATGGMPNTGELFLARESGPELVGTMGGRTTVANNDQIVDGISAGVARAMNESNQIELLTQQVALLSAILEKNPVIELDGRELNSAADDREQRSGWNFGGNK